jgi:hypothetical protein
VYNEQESAMNASAVGAGWDAESVADLLDELGVNHRWIRLQIDLIAANRSLVTRVVIGRLLAVQATAGDVQDAAGHLATLDPAALYRGLEAWAERRNRCDRSAGRSAGRAQLRVHLGGRV